MGILLALSLALVPSSAEVSEIAMGVAHVRVFDCYLPIPPGYILDASDRERFSFFRPTARPSGMIRIESHPGVHERWETVSDEPIGHLRLLELSFRSEASGADDAEVRLVLIHDGETQVSLLGEARSHALRMATACVETKSRVPE